jgi:hypothetical protein
MLVDSRHRQIPGVELVISWDGGENHFFSGFKSELGNGYADFQMKADQIYNLRAEGGSSIPNLKAPTCTNPNGGTFPGGLLLTFQQP